MADSGRTVFGGVGGGGGATLPVPDFAHGWSPGFGLEGFLPASGDGLAVFDTAYPYDAAAFASIASAVDDAWLTWNPALDSDVTPVLKRVGFYYVQWAITVNSTPSAPWALRLNALTNTPVPAGVESIVLTSTLPLDAAVVSIGFDAMTNVGLDIEYASLAFVPLFE